MQFSISASLLVPPNSHRKTATGSPSDGGVSDPAREEEKMHSSRLAVAAFLFVVPLLSQAFAVDGASSRQRSLPTAPTFKSGIMLQESSSHGSELLRGGTDSRMRRKMLFYSSSDIEGWVEAHNTERRKHFEDGEVVWDKELAQYAQEHANKVTFNVNCAPEWNENNKEYGEVLYWGVYQHGQTPWLPTEVVNEWIKQGSYYNYEKNECMEEQDCAAYLQVVWKQTARIGCGEVFCPYHDGMTRGTAQFFICNYEPAAIWENGPRPY